MAHTHCMLGNYSYKHTLTICNTHWFSHATMVARTRLNITLYVHCLACVTYPILEDIVFITAYIYMFKMPIYAYTHIYIILYYIILYYIILYYIILYYIILYYIILYYIIFRLQFKFRIAWRISCILEVKYTYKILIREHKGGASKEPKHRQHDNIKIVLKENICKWYGMDTTW